MNAVCLVAHPDDCVIFAWPFIERHKKLTWSIVYLTYEQEHERAKEASAFWSSKDIPVYFLGCDDDWDSVKQGQLGFNPEIAAAKISAKLKELNVDIILTHNNDGEYGHPHHKFVSLCADEMTEPKVYFANGINYNTKYLVNQTVDTSRWPLHKSVIEGFLNRDVGLYFVTEDAKKIL